jgi:hypothetical protein
MRNMHRGGGAGCRWPPGRMSSRRPASTMVPDLIFVRFKSYENKERIPFYKSIPTTMKFIVFTKVDPSTL